MIRRIVLPAAAWAVVAIAARATCAQQTPHPAVVRVIVPERNGSSLGSGALVALSPSHGLVVTNWHVVEDAAGEVIVKFPSGFRSLATILGTDRDWDLAALAIDRPPGIAPIPLARNAPRPGELLWIAGYGRGSYRTSAGRCTQYVAPGRNLPFEMVELDTAARKGDSGGPILNQRGELAGVLFGAGWGRTAGTYCGRVRWFLDAKARQFNRLGPRLDRETIAQRPDREMIVRRPVERAAPSNPGWSAELPSLPVQRANPQAVGDRTDDPSPVASIGEVRPLAKAPSAPVPPAAKPPPAVSAQKQNPRFEQAQTILAAIGLLAIAFHGLRLLAIAAR